MSTIKSQDEDLTLNAHGSGNDIKFQSNGVEKASISDAGLFTSTTIDATKLTGALPAISGAALTGVGVAGITSSADATAMTIDSNENIGIGVVPETWDANYDALQVGGNGSLAATPSQAAGGKTLLGQNMYVDSSYKYISTDEASLLYQQNGAFKFRVAPSGSADAAITWTDALEIKNNGRVISQSNIGFWVRFETSGTPSIQDSYNVASIGDWGTGDYGVYIATGFSNANYCVHGTCQNDRYISVNTSNTQPQGGRVDIEIRNNSNALEDMDIVYVSGIGDM